MAVRQVVAATNSLLESMGSLAVEVGLTPISPGDEQEPREAVEQASF